MTKTRKTKSRYPKPYITSENGVWRAHAVEWRGEDYTIHEYLTWKDALKSVCHWYKRGHLLPSSYRTTHKGRALKGCYCGN